jgi:hypothetical protein
MVQKGSEGGEIERLEAPSICGPEMPGTEHPRMWG